jgi:Kae1-associated kinase Bud32
MLSEGAESKVFDTSVFGKEAVVKVRQAKTYRIKKLDEALRKTRTKKEARAMQRASEAGVNTPKLLGMGKFSIYMEKVRGKLLKDILEGNTDYREIGKSLGRMHNANVVHGDFTPANIIVDGNKVCVIDFGLSDISDSIEDKAIDLFLMKRSITRKHYAYVEATYRKESRQAQEIISRLAEIEKRGRYQIRTLT